MRLAVYRNELHDEAAVHQDEWETFFHIKRYLLQGWFWSRTGNSKTINWQKFLRFLVFQL